MDEDDLLRACDGSTGHKYVWRKLYLCVFGYVFVCMYVPVLVWMSDTCMHRGGRYGLALKGKLHRIEQADREFAQRFEMHAFSPKPAFIEDEF